jgi:hypothetical protein
MDHRAGRDGRPRQWQCALNPAIDEHTAPQDLASGSPDVFFPSPPSPLYLSQFISLSFYLSAGTPESMEKLHRRIDGTEWRWSPAHIRRLRPRLHRIGRHSVLTGNRRGAEAREDRECPLPH